MTGTGKAYETGGFQILPRPVKKLNLAPHPRLPKRFPSSLAVHACQLRKPPKNVDCRKLPLCIDEETGEVVVSELTSKRAHGSSRIASLVAQIDSSASIGVVHQGTGPAPYSCSPTGPLPLSASPFAIIRGPRCNMRANGMTSKAMLMRRPSVFRGTVRW